MRFSLFSFIYYSIIMFIFISILLVCSIPRFNRHSKITRDTRVKIGINLRLFYLLRSFDKTEGNVRDRPFRFTSDLLPAAVRNGISTSSNTGILALRVQRERERER